MAREDFYNIKDLGELQPDSDPKRPAGHTKPPKSHKAGKSAKVSAPFIAIIVLLLLVIIGAGVFLAFRHHKTTPKVAATKTTTVQPAKTSTSSTSSNADTQKYVSNGNDLNLTFNYPNDWTVTPVSGDNSTDQTITLTSPLTSITNAAGATVTGKVTLTVRPGSDTINELNAASPVAAAASTQIGYTTPTAQQYQYPYVTFIHFSTGASVPGAFEEVIITGTTQFTQNEALSADDLSGLDPIISAAFTTCTTQTCTGTGAAPLSITSSDWASGSIFQQVLAVFESFQLN
ncbi:MAG TPA: hypothetical protein VMR95_01230 [Candidatus Binatia bacterium]|nr:hypothetical protein [Candidatus Binatia bacterium]